MSYLDDFEHYRPVETVTLGLLLFCHEVYSLRIDECCADDSEWTENNYLAILGKIDL